MSDAPDANKKQRKGTDAEDKDGPIIRFVLACREEAKQAKGNRVQQTRENWDTYWLRQNFSHKQPGQSREVLSMQPMAVETTSAFFQQALVDMGSEWYSVDASNPQNETFMKIDRETVKSLLQMQIEKANFLRHVVHGMKSGLLGGNIITKIHGDYYDVPKYIAKRKLFSRKATLTQEMQKAWRLRLDIVSQFNYYPDPTPTNHRRLYEIEDMWMDYSEVCALSEGEDAIYDSKVVKLIEHNSDTDADSKTDEQRRTNQNAVSHAFRGRVKITEFWGNILDENDEIIHENCVCTLANDKWLIRPPTPNPLWHQESPYVVANLLDIPDAVWPKALMDSPTKHNIAATELYNLMVDGAMKAVNNIGMLRQDWLENPDQVEGGITPGMNLNVNSQCPPGAKILEMTQTGTVPPEAMNMFQIIQQEFNRDALTSDIRSGMQPKGDTSATQVVETNQTITSVFKGLAGNVEEHWMQPLLKKAWITSMQYSDLMDEDEIRGALSPDRAERFLQMSPEERFANTARGLKFRVNGITLTLQRKQDFRQYMTLIQTVAGSQTLSEAFTKKYSWDAMLRQIMKSLGLDTQSIELSVAEQEVMKPEFQKYGEQKAQEQQAAQPQAPAPQQGSPDMMSQVPSPNTGSQQDQMGSAAPTPNQPAGGIK